jgi:hypothetical protein
VHARLQGGDRLQHQQPVQGAVALAGHDLGGALPGQQQAGPGQVGMGEVGLQVAGLAGIAALPAAELARDLRGEVQAVDQVAIGQPARPPPAQDVAPPDRPAPGRCVADLGGQGAEILPAAATSPSRTRAASGPRDRAARAAGRARSRAGLAGTGGGRTASLPDRRRAPTAGTAPPPAPGAPPPGRSRCARAPPPRPRTRPAADTSASRVGRPGLPRRQRDAAWEAGRGPLAGLNRQLPPPAPIPPARGAHLGPAPPWAPSG